MTIQDAVKLLERKFRDFKGNFTLNDAAAVTGLAVENAREALDAMMSRYVCRLRVTENGDLIYAFGNSLQRRGEKTWPERLDDLAEWAWKAFKVIFKVWITVTLVVYFVIFVVLLIALIVASSQSKDSKKSPVNLGSVFNIFFSIFRWQTATSMIGYRTDRDGLRYRSYEPRKSPINENKKSFISSVYDFVFGPPRVATDPLNNEKEVAAFLRKEKGIVTPSELVALAGWKFSEAERFLSDCLVRFKGDPVISNEGVVYGRFDQIGRGAGEVTDGKIEYYWDEYEPEFEITGNTGGRNSAIIFMNLFNLAFASFFVWVGIRKLNTMADYDVFWIALGLGWVPFIFSIIFFLIPIVRSFKVARWRRERRQANIRKRIMRVLFDDLDKKISLDETLRAVNAAKTEKPLTSEEVSDALHRMLGDFAGEMTVTEDGKPLYVFPRLAEEISAAKAIRKERKEDKELGREI